MTEIDYKPLFTEEQLSRVLQSLERLRVTLEERLTVLAVAQGGTRR